MSVTALNRRLRGRRRRLTALLLTLLAVAVAAHHMAPGHLGMGAMSAGSAMVICMAVIPAFALAATRAGDVVPVRIHTIVVIPWPVQRRTITPPMPRARASPVATVVLRH